MRAGIDAWLAAGAVAGHAFQVLALAEVYLQARQVDQGLNALAEALALGERSGGRLVDAELHRLKGELLLARAKADAERETCFRQAIELARQQEAKSWELRATVSLCRLLNQQGRVEEARRLLADIYNWFTEGFDMPDLMEAGALLEELSGT